MSRNNEVANLLEEYADLLEAQDGGYKPRTYRQAADNVRDYPTPIEDVVANGKDAVTQIDKVGDSIADKIIEYIQTGSMEALEKERDKLPVNMEELTSVEGVGPKTVGKLYRKLGITTLEELETAADNQKIRELEGFGKKTEQNILDNIDFAKRAQERHRLGDGRPIANDITSFLSSVSSVEKCDIAGSTRRWRETIGDIDVLVATTDRKQVADHFTNWDRGDEVIEKGEDKASIRIKELRVDLRLIKPEEYGSALQYFTGSQDHNISLREYAIQQNKKVNEYGVFDISDVENKDAGQRVGERLASETEEDVYQSLNLPWIPPELREDRGEIEAAKEDNLPDLLTASDIAGDLHVHTNASDGDASLETMVESADRFGHDYLCIADHADGPGVVGGNGLSDSEIRENIESIQSLSENNDLEITVLTGIEANIDVDGAIPLSDDLFSELDIIVASPHTALGDTKEDATERLCTAMQSYDIDILGHPSGRLIQSRKAMDFNISKVAQVAANNNVV
ncbi:MAG: helix-hairpin-helix domain-containing protein, partial [Halobacteriaceae archaeon]